MGRSKKQKKILTRNAVSSGLRGDVSPDPPGECDKCSSQAVYGVNGHLEGYIYSLSYCNRCYMAICKGDFGASVDKLARKKLGLPPRKVVATPSDADIKSPAKKSKSAGSSKSKKAKRKKSPPKSSLEDGFRG